MKTIITAVTLAATAFAFGQRTKPGEQFIPVNTIFSTETTPLTFKLGDFFGENAVLDSLVDMHFNQLSYGERVGQLLMPAVGRYGQEYSKIERLTQEGKIGGVLMLNGSKVQFANWIKDLNAINDSLNYLPFLYSADAEPSLINRKISGTPTIQKANTLQTKAEVIKCAQEISDELTEIGINYNFAPVVDMSPNKTVGWRSFGHEPDSVISWSSEFIQQTQSNNIIATAKHFPGHGYVTGDTHKQLVYIDGELKELHNYPGLIADSVLSIMVAHIAVKNNPTYNTNDMPATTSKKIVTDLLRDSLNFEGLIVTDAMNMGGVRNVDKAEVLAVQAGCDILLMPLDADLAHQRLLGLYSLDEDFRNQVNTACKRIIRAKIAMGLMH
ncbi:beta-N-acetylhexosaminidase [Lishizhenia tianjinensis]|uniref:beta-N-acetylhexosaminidase n=1 Tax=Lishizhenia tianjinensis TaxID=477690 RepID=A0A1I6YLY6_9FLAO|nr:glycoside hydrolase family 3 N-terminal domain-containing protein [Lishizhenia tianjinensis]SFT51445.1 beta-N-acetylhexosaminidase [Lishizhenia tianjinensis]